jgi:hypothetical protein
MPVRGAGKADTGRIFFLRGVCSDPSASASVSVSLSLASDLASGNEDECGKLAGAIVDPRDGLYGE